MLYQTYCPNPSVPIPGCKSSALSREVNGRNKYGCIAAIKVSEAAETPGVFENVSIISPMRNPHKIIAHCG